MSYVDLFMEELHSIQTEFNGFKVVPKDTSILCKIIGAVLWVLTLGQSQFMTEFHTVLGKTLYVGDSWADTSWLSRWSILRHEGVHLRQAKSCGFGVFWLGYVIWSFAYLFLLPAGFTLRAMWEREAYAETIRCSQRYGMFFDREHMISLFTGPQYLYMDPRTERIDKWLRSLGV